jgi:tagatose 1,6-diphosphate aldolase GatY/KbaY
MPLQKYPSNIIESAYTKGNAIGAFNLVDIDSVYGALDAAEELNQPLIIQTSESLVKYYGASNLYSNFTTVINQYSVPVILHLDHCSDLKIIEACLRSGWNSVMIDGSYLSLKENINITNKVIRLAKDYDALVECELGPILGEEDGSKTTNAYSSLSKKEIEEFLSNVSPDMLALGIGNKHGYYAEGGIDRLDISLLDEATNIRPLPLVLHGGTGIPDTIVLQAITKGVVKINISTELKQVYYDTYAKWVDVKKLNIPDAKKALRKNIKNKVRDYLIKFYKN